MKHYLDWSDYRDAGMGDAYADIPKTGGNFAKAVAVCINSRQCESTGRGVMCPSYRVSGKDDWSTGGRVRLLKAALNGELGDRPFLHSGLAESMDLCVGCKGCRRECENEVDMARIKVEYLAQRILEEGMSLRARLFASLPRLLSRPGLLRRLIAWRNRSRRLARFGEWFLGISAARRLPEPAADSRSFGALAGALNREVNEAAEAVVLFVDTFTGNFNPEVVEAAIEVLHAGGYRVTVAESQAPSERALCCGRSYLAQGMVEAAREEARRTLAVLLPHAAAGRPIVGLEPSCLLTLRDEYLALGLGEGATVVAGQALLLEEFIAREASAKRLQLPFRSMGADAAPVLVHGHCHQKAVGAMKAMRKVLKLIPGLQFEFIESTCCGMAGSFGIEAEHAQTAMAMAGLSLLPAVRAEPEAQVVANGFSCRHQIMEGAQRPSRHVALLLRDALAV